MPNLITRASDAAGERAAIYGRENERNNYNPTLPKARARGSGALQRPGIRPVTPVRVCWL